MRLLAHVFGTIGMLFVVIGLQNNNKTRILIASILADIFYGLQFLLLGLDSAGLICFTAVVRYLIFFYYENKRTAKIPVFWLLFFVFISIAVSFFTFDGPVSLIPSIAAVLHIYAMWQKNLKVFRTISVVFSLSWILYDLFGCAYVSLIADVFELISALVAIVRFDILKKKKKQ